MRLPIVIKVVAPKDARGWIGLGCYSLVLVVFAMINQDPTLLHDQAFLVIATAIIVTGWGNGPVGWAYQATKGGGEAAESSARIAEKAAGLETKGPLSDKLPDGTPGNPVSVTEEEKKT